MARKSALGWPESSVEAQWSDKGGIDGRVVSWSGASAVHVGFLVNPGVEDLLGHSAALHRNFELQVNLGQQGQPCVYRHDHHLW